METIITGTGLGKKMRTIVSTDTYLKLSRNQRVFITKYTSFIDAIDWSNRHYHSANLKRFRQNVEIPMENAWRVLKDNEKLECLDLI